MIFMPIGRAGKQAVLLYKMHNVRGVVPLCLSKTRTIRLIVLQYVYVLRIGSDNHQQRMYHSGSYPFRVSKKSNNHNLLGSIAGFRVGIPSFSVRVLRIKKKYGWYFGTCTTYIHVIHVNVGLFS